MKRTEKIKIVSAAVFCVFVLSGCYTKLAYYQDETAPYAERCEDCVTQRAAPGTGEVCVWERDMFGFAQLRCYNSNYSSSWLYFHNTPWWYRNQYRWYETRGCPPYYYYDRFSGSCRHYGSSHSHHGDHKHPAVGGGGSASSGSGSPARASSRRVPVNTQTSQQYQQDYDASVPMFQGSSSRQLSPVGAPVNTPSSSSNDALSKGGQDNNSETPPPPPPRVTPQQEQRQRSQEERHSDTPPARRTSRGGR